MSGYSRFELAEEIAEASGGGSPYPGMSPEMMIVTGERTQLDGFVRPIAQRANRAFREN